MEKIKIIKIHRGEVSLPDIYSEKTIKGLYYQMIVKGNDGIQRFVNLLFDCFGKWISAIDVKNNVAFVFSEEALKIDDIHEGDIIDVEANKIPAGSYNIALRLFPEV